MRNHSYENGLDLHENETTCRTHIHMKGLALRPVLKQRHLRTRKWPIKTTQRYAVHYANELLKLVKKCLKRWPLVISPNIFNLKDIIFTFIVINRVKLKSTKRAFLQEAYILIVCESSSSHFITFHMHILRFFI